MSQLEELVHEISFTVDKLSNKINEERERIKNFKVRQQELIKQNNEIQQSNDQLQADIERLEKTIYREMQQTEQLSKANELVEQRIQSLNKTLAEIDKAGEKMRSEKNILLEEYRDRINSYENYIQKNGILRNFVENWRCQVKRNKELVTFPAVIVNLAAHLEKFYSCNITGQLEALVSSREAQGDTLLDDPVHVVTKNHTQVSPASKNTASEQVAEPMVEVEGDQQMC
ncbi:hypothetical protein ECG_07793 [Echinococcus granulosus]|uniref:Expressed conserved protein n=1 Tax=Echinococcus granulosus TaxID=6210 RepID=A0A068WV49_ECHGR|nr:hypothetical protein ECG_07793 [Echinococcus granulosus]CDS22330.1 expressed conserved protein [Echinococcus granulosus]